MKDDRSPDDFAEYLRKRGWAFEKKGPENGLLFYLVSKYVVLNGLNAGKTVAIAFPIPVDYPSTAPYGIHISSQGQPDGSQGPPGGGWSFLSRRIVGWDPGRRSAQFYIDNVNRWLEA